jgi:hypothetical protein
MERGLLSDILPAINFSDVIELVDGLLLKLGSQAMMVAGLKCPYGHIMAHPNRYQNGPFMQLPQEEKEKKRKKTHSTVHSFSTTQVCSTAGMGGNGP